MRQHDADWPWPAPLRYRVRSWIEWKLIVPVRKARNRILCMFGKHIAWNDYYYSLNGMGLGPPTGVRYCVSCGMRQCKWCDGSSCEVCKLLDASLIK